MGQIKRKRNFAFDGAGMFGDGLKPRQLRITRMALMGFIGGHYQNHQSRVIEFGCLPCREWTREEIENENKRGEIRRKVWGT